MSLRSPGILLVLMAHAGFFSGVLSASDLEKRYPATFDFSEPPIGRSWSCGPEDVWELRSFTFALDQQLSVELGPASVTFGHSGTNVMWAYVEPREAGTIRCAAFPTREGVTSVWVRCHPARIAELFPEATLVGPGSADQLTWARRAAAWKMRACWHSGGLPVVPWRRFVSLDLETRSGARRCFSVDTSAGKVEYEPFFESRAMPALVPTSQPEALSVFDAVWSTFDREYAMFGLRRDVDWAALRASHRPRAAEAKTSYEVAAIIADMLSRLSDLHVWLTCGTEPLAMNHSPRLLNASMEGAQALLGPLRDSHQGVSWGRSNDGVAYLNVYSLNDVELPKRVDEMLDMLGDSWALIVDLRFNGGGGEDLAQPIAGRFLEAPVVYSLNQYRSGPEHDDLGPMRRRSVSPRGPWRWRAPLVVLIGRRTMSSAESFALMLAQVPGVVLMGDRTAGSSGHPRRLKPGLDIEVSMSTWIDYLPDGTPLEHSGVRPTIAIPFPDPPAARESDPVLKAALEHLRAQPVEAHICGRPG